MFPNLGGFVNIPVWSDLIDIGWAKTPGTSNEQYIFKDIPKRSYSASFFEEYIFTYPIMETVAGSESRVYKLLSSLAPGTYSHKQLNAIILNYLSPLSYYFKLYYLTYKNLWPCSPEAIVAVLLEAMRNNASHMNNMEQFLFSMQHKHFVTNLGSDEYFLPLQSVLGHALIQPIIQCNEINHTAYLYYVQQFLRIQNQIISDWGSVLFTEFCCASTKMIFISTEEYLMTQIMQFQSDYRAAEAHLFWGQQFVTKPMTFSSHQLIGPSYIYWMTDLEVDRFMDEIIISVPGLSEDLEEVVIPFSDLIRDLE